MLSDQEMHDIANQMMIRTPIHCFYKDQLKLQAFKPENAYIVNLASETDDNFGTHYVLLYSKHNPHRNKVLEYFYFDSEGANCPLEVLEFVQQPKIPYSNKPIQGRFNNSCGFYCLAMLYYLTTFANRVDDLYVDAEMFLDLFDDTQEKVDTLHNELMLKEFFKTMPSDADARYIQHID